MFGCNRSCECRCEGRIKQKKIIKAIEKIYEKFGGYWHIYSSLSDSHYLGETKELDGLRNRLILLENYLKVEYKTQDTSLPKYVKKRGVKCRTKNSKN